MFGNYELACKEKLKYCFHFLSFFFLSCFLLLYFFLFLLYYFLFLLCNCQLTCNKLQILLFIFLLANNQTDVSSLLFNSSYLCRMQFPLCYNFILLIRQVYFTFLSSLFHLMIRFFFCLCFQDNILTAFQAVLGNMDIVPFLGENTYLSLFFKLLLFFFLVCWLKISK